MCGNHLTITFSTIEFVEPCLKWCRDGDSITSPLRSGDAFGTMLGVKANDMTMRDIELLNERALQKAASSAAHMFAPRR